MLKQTIRWDQLGFLARSQAIFSGSTKPSSTNQSIHSHLVAHVGKEAANLMWFLRNVHGNEKHCLGG